MDQNFAYIAIAIIILIIMRGNGFQGIEILQVSLHDNNN